MDYTPIDFSTSGTNLALVLFTVVGLTTAIAFVSWGFSKTKWWDSLQLEPGYIVEVSTPEASHASSTHPKAAKIRYNEDHPNWKRYSWQQLVSAAESEPQDEEDL